MSTLPRRCLGCGTLIASGSRCSGCATRASTKASTKDRGYAGGWLRVSKQVLDRDRHTCQWCGAPARTVDHVIPLAHGGARLDPANLVAACGRCNSQRGAATRQRV